MLPILKRSDLRHQLAELGARHRTVVRVAAFAKIKRDRSLSRRKREQFCHAPSVEVVFIRGSNDLWFRTNGKNWATVFILLPGDLVLLTAEYMTGAEKVLIAPPAGTPKDGETMETCAIREAREETGILLESVHPLSSGGLAVSGRKSTELVSPFVGYPKKYKNGRPIFTEPDPDQNERIVPFLMRLPEYWELLGDGYDNTVAARDCAYAALRHIGRIKFA